MSLSEQQEKSGKLLFGDELYTKLIGSAEDKTKKLEEAGVANKSVDNPTEEVVTGLTKEDLVNELQPFIEAMNLLASKQAELQESIATQAGEIKQLKIAEAVKAKTETPRAQLFTLQRATEAQKTIITAEDPLLPKVEPVKQDGSGAQHFFPQKG